MYKRIAVSSSRIACRLRLYLSVWAQDLSDGSGQNSLWVGVIWLLGDPV